MKNTMIAIGNFFFKWRNYLFPIFVICMFIFRAPEPSFLGDAALEGLKYFLAIGAVLLGLVVRGVVIGYAYIKRGGMNKKVYADKLVTEGMFVLCRNPLYVGNMLTIIGIFIMHGDLLIMTLGITAYIFIYYCIIFAEEAYLQNKFGKDFTTYCKQTPRWIPIISRFSAATKGMEFSWKRVLLKDYPTIATNLITLALIEFVAYWTLPISDYQKALLGFIAACGVFITVINRAKKSGKIKA